MKSLAVFLAFVSLAAPLRAAESDAVALPQPVIAAPTSVPAALYSFADVYRLTTGRTPVGLPQPQRAAETAIRVAVVEAAAADEPRFSVRQLPGASSWLLALAGLALAGWVAHRRLSYL